MIYVKHLLDAVEKTDGQRMWVEPIGLTRDFAIYDSDDQQHGCELPHCYFHIVVRLYGVSRTGPTSP